MKQAVISRFHFKTSKTLDKVNYGAASFIIFNLLNFIIQSHMHLLNDRSDLTFSNR